MELNPKVAKNIVNSLKSTIQHEINLFNTKGIIIASTDQHRIGDKHSGALEVLNTQDVNIIYEDDANKGVKKGVNMPILFNDKIVAVVGITGDPKKVQDYITIIKKMTEILIRENSFQVSNFNNRRNIDHLVSMLISSQQDDELVASLASMIHVNLNQPCYVAVANIPKENYLEIHSENFQKKLDAILATYHVSLFTFKNQQLCFLIHLNDLKKVRQLLRDIEKMVTSQAAPLVFGLSNKVPNSQQIHIGYKEAQQALRWGDFDHKQNIYEYNHLEATAELMALPKEQMAVYVNKVLGSLTTDQKKEYETIIQAYSDANGSIIHGAALLFIHKNTFQNKLNKFHELTGYNPRNLQDFSIIRLAFLFEEYLSH